MSAIPLEDPTPGEPYDEALRWKIASRTDPHTEYVVQLGAEPGYSVCPCTDFQTHFYPLLKRGIKPAAALAAGLVTKRKYQSSDDDVLKCWHICEAEKALAKATIRAFSHARSKTTHRENRAP